jgi:hypothetical protein
MAIVSDVAQGPGWWLASDGRWYPPQAAPPPVYAPMMPGYGGPYRGWGPLGKRESIALQVLLSFVTCGFYGYYWAYKSHEEIKRHTGDGVGGGLGLVIYIFASMATLFLLPIEIKQMYERDGRRSPVSATTAFWALLLVIPWYVKCQSALNDYWASKGAPPP